ncbi:MULTISPECIES: thiamine-binding protein [Streptococcus]|uniref:thiamine-binding protein n=1 Tax=Streptococcus TaxID=1301 RepID=UPI00066CEE22|nr:MULTISPECIES: thiamine-binding protein [Streptococcus]MDO6346430.1 thiamine-binding protein [Streptococcus sp. GP0011]
MKASIALQVLPLSQGIDRIAIIDQVITYLQAQSVTMVVTPFETVLEGEFDELMRILKETLEVAGQEADNVFANVKINIGEILSIDDKLEKYTETTH